MSKNDLLAGLALVRESRESRTRARATFLRLAEDPDAPNQAPFKGEGESVESAQRKAGVMATKLAEDIRVLALVEQLVHAATVAAERSFQ